MSPPSTAWGTVQVFGTYRNMDGSPKTGSLKFTVDTRVVDNTGHIIFPRGSSFTVKLSVESGSFSVALPANDDPDITPRNWQIKVEEKFDDASGQTYFIETRQALAATGGLDLSLIEVPATAPTAQPVLAKGVPGGIAALDSDGDVLNSRGEKVGGGGGSAPARLPYASTLNFTAGQSRVIEHGLGDNDVIVQCVDTTTKEVVDLSVLIAADGVGTVTVGSPVAGVFRIVVIG